ncbi:hypothetical protein ACFVZ3_12540 [Kitasatospora purpeofusca]|uniref:hypothetical protein n=1 Tax=Kitasatospora purpeofusca TaxID=67352 RepID=UPI00369323B3
MTTAIAGPPQVRRDPDLARAQAATAEAATWIEELAERLPLRHAQPYRTMTEAVRGAGERLNPFDDLMAGIDGDIRCALGADSALGLISCGPPPVPTAGELTAVAAVSGLVVTMAERITALDLHDWRKTVRACAASSTRPSRLAGQPPLHHPRGSPDAVIRPAVPLRAGRASVTDRRARFAEAEHPAAWRPTAAAPVGSAGRILAKGWSERGGDAA